MAICKGSSCGKKLSKGKHKHGWCAECDPDYLRRGRRSQLGVKRHCRVCHCRLSARRQTLLMDTCSKHGPKLCRGRPTRVTPTIHKRRARRPRRQLRIAEPFCGTCTNSGIVGHSAQHCPQLVIWVKRTLPQLWTAGTHTASCCPKGKGKSKRDGSGKSSANVDEPCVHFPNGTCPHQNDPNNCQ